MARLQWLVAAAWLLLFAKQSAAAEPIDFTRDIAPIFRAHCLDCHGAKTQKSGYRLDVRTQALAGGDFGAAAIVPGRSADSPLYRYVAGLEQDVRMPPADSQTAPLTKAELELLRRWIDSGAVWPENASAKLDDPRAWWCWQPVVRRDPPKADVAPIDAFVDARLAREHLTRSPEADARTLCRRLYFDLTGLPPEADVLDRFVAEYAQAASATERERVYVALVDRLLASPAYGERWARHWLDVVHYGDTHGYDKDKQRLNAWPYRDYVIRVLNADKPYARFIEEQIAGDVLYAKTRDGIEALGFIAAGPWDYIGHAEVPESKIDGQIARHLDRDDMIGNTIGTFASVTVQCAQCHNHKFDPITQEDYYSLQAVFAALDRADKKYFAEPEQGRRYEELVRQQHELTDRRIQAEAEARSGFERDIKDLDEQLVMTKQSFVGDLPVAYGYHSSIAAKRDVEKWVQLDLGRSRSLERIVVHPCYDNFAGVGADFGWPLRMRIEVSDDPQFATKTLVATVDTPDDRRPRLAPQIYTAVGRAGRYVRVTASELATRSNDYILALAEVEVLDDLGENVAHGAKVTALDSIEAAPRWARANLVDNAAPPIEAFRPVAEVMAKRESIERQVREQAKSADLIRQIDETSAKLKQLVPTGVVYAGTVHTGKGTFVGTGPNGGKPRTIRVLARGDVRQPTREVGPGSLTAIDVLPARFDISPTADEGARRAALAHWLADPRNPLTWRSIVNRVWQYHFGRGIVATANDFGRMGERPTHPELLDWLAAEFLAHGGSLKWLHREIVTSRTWRQSSISPNEAAARVDVTNTLLWRQNRHKLEAEAVRDAILVVAGTLEAKMGGPGYRDFVVEHPEHSPHYEYAKADPLDRSTWRRSVYRFIVRSQTQPFMALLDCADPSMRVERRNESISATQALALLNDGFVLVQAEQMAARVEREAGSDPAAQVAHAVRLTLGREPKPDENRQLIELAREHGLANVCRVLFNLNEFAFVD